MKNFIPLNKIEIPTCHIEAPTCYYVFVDISNNTTKKFQLVGHIRFDGLWSLDGCKVCHLFTADYDSMLYKELQYKTEIIRDVYIFDKYLNVPLGIHKDSRIIKESYANKYDIPITIYFNKRNIS